MTTSDTTPAGQTPWGDAPGGPTAPRAIGHAAPHRAQASSAALWFGLFAAPAAWSIQTLVNYPLAAHSCYPALTPRATPSFGGLTLTTLLVSLVATAVGVAAGLLAYREWTRTRGEMGASADGSRQAAVGVDTRAPGSDRSATGAPADIRSALEIGEGRTRFMAMSGMLTSGVFVLASLLHGLTVFLVSPCGM